MKRVYGWADGRAGGRTGGRAGVCYVIAKFSQMDSLPNILTHGAPLLYTNGEGHFYAFS